MPRWARTIKSQADTPDFAAAAPTWRADVAAQRASKGGPMGPKRDPYRIRMFFALFNEDSSKPIPTHFPISTRRKCMATA